MKGKGTRGLLRDSQKSYLVIGGFWGNVEAIILQKVGKVEYKEKGVKIRFLS